MIVPIISSKEIALAEYPTHSRHYKGLDTDVVEKLSRRKAKRLTLAVN
ncbi:MAG: hypothetical protein ACI9UJ_001689 [bacterium]|jgi:hypothetical protein